MIRYELEVILLGRKPTILAASVVFAAGSVVMGVAGDKETLLGGRVVVGAAIGLASSVVPVYISEAAPVHLRGSLTVSYNTLVVAGQFVATLVCGAFSSVSGGWRWMLGLAGLPAIIQLVGFVFMPESPRWLVSRGRGDEARDILATIRPAGHDVAAEVAEISAAVEKDRAGGGGGGGGGGAGASAAAAGGLQRRGRLHAAGQRQDPAHRHRRQRPRELRIKYFWSLLKIFESNPDT